jgi:hypothetical protein
MVIESISETALLPCRLLVHESWTPMSLEACRLALEQLRSFALPPAEIRSTDERDLDALTRLAANFANELHRAGGGEVLTNRSDEFGRLTAPGSEFDRARNEAHNLLASPGEGLCQPGPSPSRRSPTRDDPYRHPSIARSDIRRIHRDLAQLERVRRHLPSTSEDVERLLGRRPADQERQVLQRWQREVWCLSRLCEQDHLFGAHLLARCRKARDPRTGDPEALHALLQELGEDILRAVRSIQDAAVYLLARLPAEVKSSGDAGIEAEPSDSAKWLCHTVDETPTAEFKFGPIQGTLTSLAKSLCPSFECEPDRRAVKRLADRRAIWVQKISGQCYKVYFKDQKTYAEANAALTGINAQK